MNIDLAWHPADRPSDEALAEHVGRCLGVEPALVRTGRHCPSCGSDTHGRPWTRLEDGTRVAVSLSRAGDHLVTAISLGHVGDEVPRGASTESANESEIGVDLGVDIEVVADVEARWNPRLVLHPDDPPGVDPTWAWCAKEAILKSTGTGLAVPMTDVRLADHRVMERAAPAGLICVVAFTRR
ncbi:hypothetical protein ASG90_20665 [Nocardioides sp. Soil797]|nr:hypothetical protein ASG90_20665 [Nocardioides sp. Soil797]